MTAVDPMAIIAQQVEIIARLTREIESLRAEKTKKSSGAERQARYRERHRDVTVTSHVTETLTPPVPPTSPAPRTPHPHPPHNPPLNPAHVPAHVGTPEPLPFEDGPVLEPGDGDDILEAKSPSLVQVPAPSSRQVRPAPKPRDVYTADFEAFWAAYPGPRKIDKADAFKRWKAVLGRGVAVADLMAGLQAWRISADWLKDDGAYICAPSVWLNKQRWEDAPAPAVAQKIVPIASGPADDLAGYRKLVAWCHSDRERVEVLVDRARGVNKVVLDLAEALEILEGRGIDAAIRWVAMATQAGVKARQGVSRG